jgi:hypothetical protein
MQRGMEMANRTMQQKSRKMRDQRRAWAKPLSRSNHAIPNRGVLGEYKERAKGLALSEVEIDDLIRRYYKHEPFTGTGPGRKAAQDLMQELYYLVPGMLFFDVFPANCYQRCRLYFNATRTCWILVHDDYRKKTVRRSMEYPSKENAVKAWHTDKVVWVARPIPNGT